MAVRTSASRAALVVPDAGLWAAAGIDLAGLGFEPVAAPGQAELMLLPERLPRELAPAVRELRQRLPDPEAVEIVEGPGLGGVDARSILAGKLSAGVERVGPPGAGERETEAGEGGEGSGEEEDHADDHGHGDMMAVTGEPSADGLVMEDADAVVGPIAPALPTGLVLELTLDGDVVAAAELRSLLAGPLADGRADPHARSALRWAQRRADRARPLEASDVPALLAATEIERALSHAAWLARFLHLLGWVELSERIAAGARPLIAAHRRFLENPTDPVEPPSSDRLEGALRALLESGRLRPRIAGLAPVSAADCRERGVGGPVARASGVDDDVRSADAAYAELDFAPVTDRAGDAEARMRVRAEEILASLALAGAAAQRSELPADATAPVEGPRGPLTVGAAGPAGPVVSTAPGLRAMLGLAASTAVGNELARALVAVASFDPGPWRVGG